MGQKSEPAFLRGRPRRVLLRAAWLANGVLPSRRPPSLPEWWGPTTTLRPIVVGGTGRSGTSVTARLLGNDPEYYLIPFEVKFISDRGGLTELIAGRTTIASFERRLLGTWFRRTQDRGLHQITDRETIRAAVRELNADLKGDAILAARRFTHRLLDPPTVAAGKQGWIENTPNTIRAARLLSQILPEARLVHMVRDGRDVACSVTHRRWGPKDVDGGLRWWADHLERSFEESAAVGEERVLALRMESLMSYDREPNFCRMLDFLGLRDDGPVRTYFEEQVSGERAHIGRWRTDIPPEAQPAFLETYRELSAGLAERWAYDPDLTDAAPVAASS